MSLFNFRNLTAFVFVGLMVPCKTFAAAGNNRLLESVQRQYDQHAPVRAQEKEGQERRILASEQQKEVQTMEQQFENEKKQIQERDKQRKDLEKEESKSRGQVYAEENGDMNHLLCVHQRDLQAIKLKELTAEYEAKSKLLSNYSLVVTSPQSAPTSYSDFEISTRDVFKKLVFSNIDGYFAFKDYQFAYYGNTDDLKHNKLDGKMSIVLYRSPANKMYNPNHPAHSYTYKVNSWNEKVDCAQLTQEQYESGMRACGYGYVLDSQPPAH